MFTTESEVKSTPFYQSWTSGLSNEDFKNTPTNGHKTFISFESLMERTLGDQVKPNERIIGMVVDGDGITLHLEFKKK